MELARLAKMDACFKTRRHYGTEAVLKQKWERKINRWNFNYSPNRRQLYVSPIQHGA